MNFTKRIARFLLIKPINVVSRWIIFSIDQVICLLSLLFAFALQHNVDINSYHPIELIRNLFILATINSVVFYNFKTYSGIIRYTGIQDSFRILSTLIVSGILFYLINLFFITFAQTSIITIPVLINSSLISFLLLINYRVLIKYFFNFLNKLDLDKLNVIIYGAGESGLLTKRIYDHNKDIDKNIIAFIDDDNNRLGKTIDGIKIYHANELNNLIEAHGIDELIFASDTISAERKEELVDLCLELNVKILNIPPADTWTNGQFKPTQVKKLNIEDLLNRKTIDIDIKGIGDMLNGNRILITGAAGSIGSEIVRQLSKFDVGLIILCDQSETALHELHLELEEKNKNKNYVAFIGDVRDESRMEFLFSTYKPHYVYHAAAYKHVPLMENNSCEAVKVNVLGTKIIANKSVEHGVHKFVMVSTDKAVNPTNIMGATKRIAEIYVQSLNNSLNNPNFIFSNGLSYINELNVKPITKFITTRFGNVLGSNGSVIPRFKKQIEAGGPLTVTHPDITRYFMTIPEACKLVLEAGCMGKRGEIFVFDMGKSVKIIDVAKKMIRLAGLEPNVDINIEFSGLRPGEKLYEELLNDGENTIPTHHEKIMIGKVRTYEFAEAQKQISNLINLAKFGNDREVVLEMKKILPEFISKNSIYEKLDYAKQS